MIDRTGCTGSATQKIAPQKNANPAALEKFQCQIRIFFANIKRLFAPLKQFLDFLARLLGLVGQLGIRSQPNDLQI